MSLEFNEWNLKTLRCYRVKPHWDLFVEWHMWKRLYMEYHWLQQTNFNILRANWHIICVYTKVKANNRRWRKYKRVYVDSYEILRFLHYKWIVDLDVQKFKRTSQKRNNDTFWMLKTAWFRKEVRDQITKQLLPQLMVIVSQYGRRPDRRIAEGFKKFLIPNGWQQTINSDEWSDTLNEDTTKKQ